MRPATSCHASSVPFEAMAGATIVLVLARSIEGDHLGGWAAGVIALLSASDATLVRHLLRM